MGWAYHFVDLDDEQKDNRRLLLDWYGAFAQSSVLIPLLAIQLYHLLIWIQRRSRKQANLSAPSSPSLKHSRHSSSAGIGSLATKTREIFWWCGDDVKILGQSLGTKGEVIGAVAWTAWLLLLSFLRTGDDYLHLTKRFGIVAASQLPFHYLLALKTPYSPLQFLSRSSHETLIAIHQILGRIVTVLMYAHAAFYLNFYIQSSLLPSKLKEGYVRCGVLGVLIFTLINTSSLAPTRKWNYRVFLAMHIGLSTIILPILFFHVSHLRIYIFEAIVIILVNVVFRATSTRTYTNATLNVLPNTQLLEIKIPLPSKSSRPLWTTGQHAYISAQNHPLKAIVKKNPFTLSSIPAVDGQLHFVARIHSGTTAELAAAASHSKGPHRVSIEGPYGVTTHPDKLLQFDRILLIAGGVGGTFIAPLYRQLLSDLSPGKGSYRRQKVSAVWIARSIADVTWAVPEDEAERDGFLERINFCVTGSDASSATFGDSSHSGLYETPVREGAEEDGIEMQERSNLLGGEQQTGGRADLQQDGLNVHSGRPNIGRLVDQAFSFGAEERVAVLVCGPSGLGREVRKEVSRWVHKGRDVWFWREAFAL